MMNNLETSWFYNNFKKSLFYYIFSIIFQSFNKSLIISYFKGPEIRSSLINKSYIIQLFYSNIRHLSIFDYLYKINLFLLERSNKLLYISFSVLFISVFIKNSSYFNLITIFALLFLFYYIILKVINNQLFEYKKIVFNVLIISFVIKVIGLVLANNLIYISDEITIYDTFSWIKAESWINQKEYIDFNTFNPTTVSSQTVFYFISTIYFLFGHNILIAKIFFLFINIVTSIIIFLIAKELFSERVAVISFILFSFSPAISFWSTILQKEGIFILLSALIFLLFNKVIKKFSIINLSLLLILLYLAYEIRSHVLIIILIALSISFLLNVVKIEQYFLLIVIILILLFILSPQINQLISEYSVRIGYHRNAFLSEGGNLFSKDVKISDSNELIRFIPIATIYGLLLPFPWQINKLNELLALLDIIIFYLLFSFIIYGLYLSLRYNLLKANHIIIYTIIVLLLYSLIEANIGNLIRHRIQATAFMIIFAARGIDSLLKE